MAEEEDREPLEALTIYLAKPGCEKPSDSIEEMAALKTFAVSDEEGALGTLYVQTRRAKPPKWGRFFAPQIRAADLGHVSSTAALFHVVVDRRAFLLSFGQGRHLLRAESYEERFGLRVTLNSIDPERVRSIDKHTLDTIGRHTRVQASKEATAGEFGLDIEQDLLRAITGRPNDPSLGQTLSGLDSLHVIARASLDTLKPLLSRYLAQFGKDTYKANFPWVDHIAEIKDSVTKERLDARMVDTVAGGRSDKCWLAVPEPIEWASIAGFRYGPGRKHGIVNDIRFESLLRDCALDASKVTVDFLKRHRVMAVDGDGSQRYGWPLYKCVYCEIEDATDTFLLSGGHWYKVASDFVAQVNASYRGIPRYEVELPAYADGSESEYSARVAKGDADAFTLMDRKLISIGGGHSSVEFCDLFTRERDLIHIKRYGGSGLLSHLFAQGVISGQLFVSDAAFRKAVNERLPPAFKLRDMQSRPDARTFRVVFAIISAETGSSLTIPFFSRLNARHAVQAMESYGYRVALAKIRVQDAVTKTRKYPKAKRRKAA